MAPITHTLTHLLPSARLCRSPTNQPTPAWETNPCASVSHSRDRCLALAGTFSIWGGSNYGNDGKANQRILTSYPAPPSTVNRSWYREGLARDDETCWGGGGSFISRRFPPDLPWVLQLSPSRIRFSAEEEGKPCSLSTRAKQKWGGGGGHILVRLSAEDPDAYRHMLWPLSSLLPPSSLPLSLFLFSKT